MEKNKLHEAIDADIECAVNAGAAGLCKMLKEISDAIVVHKQVDPMIEVKRLCDEHRKELNILV